MFTEVTTWHNICDKNSIILDNCFDIVGNVVQEQQYMHYVFFIITFIMKCLFFFSFHLVTFKPFQSNYLFI